MRKSFLVTALIAAAIVSPSSRAADGRWFFSTGIDYSNGDYGEARDTTILTVPLTAGYVAERWSAELIVPIVDIKGPGTIERHGGYEDVYVKTPNGWRIKSRTHVRNKAWHAPALQTPDLN